MGNGSREVVPGGSSLLFLGLSSVAEREGNKNASCRGEVRRRGKRPVLGAEPCGSGETLKEEPAGLPNPRPSTVTTLTS